jgi:uncharacterized protein (DUF1330 family)
MRSALYDDDVPTRITVVAILTVRKEAIEQFRAFESHAARVMNKYGGSLQMTILASPDGSSEVIKEVHVMTFPTEEAFAAYRRDKELEHAADLRNQSVVHTEIVVEVDGPELDSP